jgi:hypothetical protein
MTFKKLTEKIVANFVFKVTENKKLFKVDISGDDLWNIYLSSFDRDPVFRDPESSTHNCNTCKNFIRRYGNVVGLDEGNNILSIFDIEAEGEYKPVIEALKSAIKKAKIKDVFFETFNDLKKLNYERCDRDAEFFRLGHSSNYKMYSKEEAEKFGVVKEKEVRTFNHFYLDLPKDFVDFSGRSVEAVIGDYRASKEVFQRAMREIPLGTLELVRDLINQGSLLDGQTHLYKIEQIIPLKKEYDELPAKKRDSWCWGNSYKLPFAKFKNELIGVLCTELAEGKELNEACQSWNKSVDPANYMKAEAPITKKQIEEAKKFVEENGYEESFNRRFATIDDIKVSEILHSNTGNGETPKVSIFDNVKATSTRHKRSKFEGVEEVSIDQFMKNILPTCTSLEAFLTNKQEGNMVSLTTASNPDSKPIFKWSNNYSWTFNGNLAGKSLIKEAVKDAGGRIDGVLRASMIWNESGSDNSDLDIWCEQPNGEEIGYSTNFRKDKGGSFSSCSGQLDLDNTNPGSKMGIENIYFKDLSKMKEGVYRFWVNQYTARNSQDFKFEIEFDGEVFNYEYNQPVSGNVQVAEVTLKNGQFSIKHLLPEAHSNKEIYSLETNNFHKVNLVCLSPNHWGENKTGNKHYFFILDKAKAPNSIRSFHNENLISDLLKHRKVMEVLGNQTMLEPTDKQLSGLGFNATIRDELIIKIQGTHKRVLKIKF